MKHVVVATHGHCFDGLASAALFTRLFRELRTAESRFTYHAVGYGAGQQSVTSAMLGGDENAILDYRFSAEGRLTWYFDHHRTAFGSESERALFERLSADAPFFHDESYSSCTRLIADVAERRYGLTFPELSELVRWADIVDSAAFASAQAAIDRTEPVLRLVSVVEHWADDAFVQKLVPSLLSEPLDVVARSKEVERRYRPIGEKQERFQKRVREKGERMGRVVFVDLTDAVLDTIGKFVTYALYPDATYSVVVARLRSGAKISVGFNPWAGKPIDTDISAICARYGGGGHAVVGAIPFGATELDRARSVARAIAVELAA